MDLSSLRRKLGLEDIGEEILVEALTHPSCLDETDSSRPRRSNQRLEFLGDAVLGLIVAHYLFETLPHAPEGLLTRIKSRAVRRETLAELARSLALGEFVLLGPEEEASGGREKPSILADCMEAIIGAVYISAGLEAARDFVMAHMGQRLAELVAEGSQLDPKTELQELLQRLTQETPSYITVAEEGPPHRRIFEVEVRYRGTTLGRGRGTSKQRAQQAAARQALERRDEWLAEIAHSSERHR